MTKYYRVRTQEQWDWLVSKLNVCRVEPIDYPMIVCHEQGRRNYSLIKYHKGPEPIIEVSQMMEESRMEDYVTINSEALKQIRWGTNYGKFGFIDHDEDGENHVYEQYLPANLEIPKFLVYPKVPMTEAEKKEFDMAAGLSITPVEFLEEIESSCGDEYPCLFNKMFCGQTEKDNSKAQIEFIRALADPSIIEVIPEKKWNVKVPVADGPTFYYKTGDGVDVCKPSPTMQNLETTRFTAEEIKQYGLDNDLFEKVEVSE